MRLFFKLLPFLLLAAALAFAATQLKRVARLAEGFKAGKPPTAEALKQAAAADKTGTIAKLLDAQEAQLKRLTSAADAGETAVGEGPLVAEQAAKPEEASARRGPVEATDTNSGAPVQLSRGGAARAPRRGGAVLVDRATGERLEVSGTRPVLSPAAAARQAVAEVQARLPAAEAPSLLPETGDLQTRKRRAEGLLLGTVLAAAALLLWSRRAMRG